MARILLNLVFAFALLGVAAAWGPAWASDPLENRVLGDPNAPVTIQEFSSLTCPHCAHFHAETLPKIKEKYVDTGKVKVVMRDFPLGDRAMVAAMVARCGPEDRYFGLLDILFKTQAEWSRAEDFIGGLAKVTRLAGIGEADIMACLRNEALLQGLRKQQAEISEEYDVNSTPTFIVGEEKIVGSQPFEVFEAAINKALGQ